jgi:tRNA threonylcarbamoyladenosine biosynthesis protein TsaE
MEFISIKQLQKLANQISKKVLAGDTIYLKGEIGAGKTTFSRFLIHYIQEKNKIKQEEVVSPTFNIVQYYYITKKLHIAHYDLYRIKKAKDLMNIGLYNQEEFFLNIIEWPELIKKKNKNRIEIVLKHTKNNDLRKYNVKYFGRFKK